ncbi:MAG: hypothetical protein Q9163_005705 [Psora crenata]
MATNRSLATLLRALQTQADAEDLSRLLGSATTLLTFLVNPLNVTLLTSQLLSAPSIWQRPDGLRTILHILNVFSSAARHLVLKEAPSTHSQAYPTQRVLAKEDWAIAVIKGADDRSPRWRHLCVLAGLLRGFEGRGQGAISKSLRQTLESGAVKAVSLALRGGETEEELAANSIVMMLSQIFDLLSDGEKRELDQDLLLPILYRAPFFSRDGLQSGYFLSTIDADIIQTTRTKFDWSPKSSTYTQCHRMANGPLMSCLGSLSRLTAFSVEQVQDPDLLPTMIKDLCSFTRSLVVQWRQNKLSEIDVTEESMHLSEETLRTTLPTLWRTLRSTMFAIIVILRALLSRVLGDPRLPTDVGPFLAAQTLHILRNLFFVSSRAGSSSFSQYSFVYLAAIDILSQYPVQSEAFLRDIQPHTSGDIPQHPLDRCHDLFFLNTAEHFALVSDPEISETMLIGASTPYLGLDSDPRLVEIFEAAHSVMLAVLSVPQNIDLLSKHIHPYLEVLFKVFPQTLTPRQFRMAIKTLIRIASPPSQIAMKEELLPSIIMELVRCRLEQAAPTLLQQKASEDGAAVRQENLSEQSALELSLIDSLPSLPIEQLEEWLPVVVESLSLVQDSNQQRICRERFWEVLSNGEMDVERAAFCVTWWGTRGGRAVVLDGHAEDQASASGHGHSWRRLKHPWPSKSHNELLKAIESKNLRPRVRSTDVTPQEHHSDHSQNAPTNASVQHETCIESSEGSTHELSCHPSEPRSISTTTDFKTVEIHKTESTWISRAMRSNSIRKRLRRPSDKVTRGVPKTPETSPSRDHRSKYHVAIPSRKLAQVPSNDISGIPGVPKDQIGSVPKRPSSSEGSRPPLATMRLNSRRKSKTDGLAEESGGATTRFASLKRSCERSLKWLEGKLQSDTGVDPSPYASPSQTL